MRRYIFKLMVIILLGLLSSCEEDMKLDLPPAQQKIVVEGYIEQGLPPVVLLTYSAPYFSKVNVSDISAYFVHKATVQVFDDAGNRFDLKEVASDTLPAMYASLLNAQLGHDSLAVQTYYFYTVDPAHPLLGKAGHRYDLHILADDKTLSASTSIPTLVPLDSIWWQAMTDPAKKDFVEVIAGVNDPDTLGNYYRYFTQRGKEPYYPGLASVYEDTYTNGTHFPFPLQRGQSPASQPDLNTYGLFSRGDTINVKWCSIDRSTFLFWRSAELQLGSAGNPFSTLVRANNNIQGGLGIWAGYGASYYKIVIPK